MISLTEHDALLVVDMQNDFLPGGALAVAGSDAILPTVAQYLNRFADRNVPVFASRDWHPANHMSFQAQKGPWPAHCVADTDGADFHPSLVFPQGTTIVSKGFDATREAYSALDSTGLAQTLRTNGINRVFVCGLATDYCVLASAQDLLSEGFEVVLLLDAVRPVDVNPGDGEQAIDELKAAGALTAEFTDIAF